MSKYNRVLLVVNPISGGVDKTEIVDYLETMLDREQKTLSIYSTTGEKDKEKLTEIIKNYQPERILIAGGDGTIKLIAEILKENTIPIGIFPAGSANGLAENLELPSEIEELAIVALGDNYVDIDALVINGELCLHISDIGLNAALIKNYEEGNIRGKLGYLIQSIPTLIKSDFPFKFKITIKEKIIRKEAVLVAIANAKKYGTGSTINPNGKFDDGKFEILIFKEFNIPQILKTFQEDVHLSEDFIEIFPTSKATIECEKEIPFQIDGEFRGEIRKVEAAIYPFKVKIATPKTVKA